MYMCVVVSQTLVNNDKRDEQRQERLQKGLQKKGDRYVHVRLGKKKNVLLFMKML
jgi:hypothetical protein